MPNLLFHPRFESSSNPVLKVLSPERCPTWRNLLRKVTILIVCRCIYIYTVYTIYIYTYVYIWAMSSAMFNYWKVIPMNIPISLVKSQQKSPSNVHVQNSSPHPIHPSESPLIPLITRKNTIKTYGCGSKPCTPGEPQNSW